jgi:glycine hydroxymethyltransferase
MQQMTSQLPTIDPEIAALIAAEEERQRNTIELIASENYTSPAVMEALGSVFTNKYAEGYPGARYYGGTAVADELERLCVARALTAFGLSADEWSCNVQAYSGSGANLAVYKALLEPGDVLMGMELASGGHLSHGFATAKRKVTAAAAYYTSVPYKVAPTGWIDYDAIERQVLEVRPKLLICGASAYSRDWDYARLRRAADSVGAYLMADIAHISGFVATGLMASPFHHCDVVTTTTHKTLRGPRAALIFTKVALSKAVNDAVFPGLQGGPHMNAVAAVAVQLREVATPAFRDYMQRVLANTRALAVALIGLGYTIVTGGTDNHLILVDLRSTGTDGAEVSRRLESVGISVNKNTISGDTSAFKPSGIRLGTPAVTSRGWGPVEMGVIASFVDRAICGESESLAADVAEFMRAHK